MVAFVGKYCMSMLFSTEDAFVRKREGIWEHTSESGPEGGRNGRVAGPFLERNRAKAKKSVGVSTLLGRQVLGPGLLPWDFAQAERLGCFSC